MLIDPAEIRCCKCKDPKTLAEMCKGKNGGYANCCLECKRKYSKNLYRRKGRKEYIKPHPRAKIQDWPEYTHETCQVVAPDWGSDSHLTRKELQELLGMSWFSPGTRIIRGAIQYNIIGKMNN